MRWHVRAAVVGSSGNVGGGLGAGSRSSLCGTVRGLCLSLALSRSKAVELRLGLMSKAQREFVLLVRDITLFVRARAGRRVARRGGAATRRTRHPVSHTETHRLRETADTRCALTRTCVSTQRVAASRPRRSTSCGSGLSLRSEVYYFSAPNIAYFTVYSTTRAHDSLGSLLAPLRAQSQGEAPRLRAARCGYLLYTSTTPYHLRPCGVPSHSDE